MLQFDNINIPIPEEFHSWTLRRRNMDAERNIAVKANVAFVHDGEDKVDIAFISCTEFIQFNVNWNQELLSFIKESIKERLKMEQSFENVFNQEEFLS